MTSPDDQHRLVVDRDGTLALADVSDAVIPEATPDLKVGDQSGL